MTDINTKVDELIAQRKAWENGTYAASNKELYAVLAKCLALYNEIARSMELSRGLNKMLALRGITHNKSTSMPLKVVRLIFVDAQNNDRFASRMFTYAKVLKIAKDENCTPDNLHNFITERGGVDEIRRNSSDGLTDAQKAKQYEAIAEVTFNDQAQEIAKLTKVPPTLQPADGTQFTVALVRKNADGTSSIVYGSQKTALVSALLVEAGKKLQEQAAKNAKAKQSETVRITIDENLRSLEAMLPASAEFNEAVGIA